MPVSHHTQLFLGRQPILGRDQQLLAYELLFRDGLIATGNRADILDATQATATVIANTFTELATNDVLGPYRGFINIDQEMLFSDLIEALPPQLVVLEILETVQPTQEVIERCTALRKIGFTLAVDDVIHANETYRPLFELADIIKVDIAEMPKSHLRSLVAQLKPYGKQLLAEKVEFVEQHIFCRRLGFDLFQGYYFAKPTIIVGKKLNPAQVSLIHLLSLLTDEVETATIENAFKLEPGLTVNMLRLTNSVSNGLTTKVTSLRHAITILGRRQLQRWLQLLIYTTPKGTQQISNPLLQLAATRGRLMELLAAHAQPSQREIAEQAFMVGIMSLMPTLLGMSMPDILAQLPVVSSVKQALSEEGGRLNQLLKVAEATEQTDLSVLKKALEAFPMIKPETLDLCFVQAFSWANNLAQDKI